MKEFGIITIASKHSYYGKAAWNLCLSAKSNDMGIPVSVIADIDGIVALQEHQQAMFDKVIIPDPGLYRHKGELRPLMLKFLLDKLSPYKRTLFMDADTIVSPLQDVKVWFESMKGIEFTMKNRGLCDPDKGISGWVDSGVFRSHYPDLKYHDLSSEFIYFERSDGVTKLFETAYAAYKEDSIIMRQFAGDRPDEPFFNIAMDATGISPHKSPYYPLYWKPEHKTPISDVDMFRKYFGMSIGGKEVDRFQMKTYDKICSIVQFKTGASTINVGHKKQYIPERKLM